MPCNPTVNYLLIWSESSGCIFNQSKCKYQRTISKRTYVQYTYTINETLLESCDIEKDLDVWASSNLTSDKQVTNCARKPTNFTALGAQPRDTSNAPKRVAHCILISIVRCHLSYATQVWSPQSIGLLKQVANACSGVQLTLFWSFLTVPM